MASTATHPVKQLEALDMGTATLRRRLEVTLSLNKPKLDNLASDIWKSADPPGVHS